MDTSVQTEMRRRIRIHMLTSVGGVVLAFVTAGVLSGVAQAMGGASAPTIAGFGALAAIGLIPVIGFWSTFRNLRCPACNGLVAWQVSQKYSAFGAFARNECRHCGVTIFAPAAGRRALILIGIIAAATFLFAAAMGGFMAQRRAHVDVPASGSTGP